MTTKHILDLLRKKYPSPEFIFLPELRMGSGYKTRTKKYIESRIDAWILNTYPSKKFITLAIECKISYADWRNEFKKDKQYGARLVSNELWYICPSGIIPLSEVPEWAGLMYVNDKDKIIVQKQAPFRKIDSPDWQFVASLGRRVNAIEHLDLKNLSDDILHRMITALYEGNQNMLNHDEFNYYIKLSNELIRRSNIKYNKANSDYKAYQKFQWLLRNPYPYISNGKIDQLWELIKENKIRIKKKRLEFVNNFLTEEEKTQYQNFKSR